MMAKSKLDGIVFRCFDQGHYWGVLTETEPDMADVPDEPIDRTEAVKQIKVLMLETFSKALEAKSIEEMGEIFRKEVEAL